MEIDLKHLFDKDAEDGEDEDQTATKGRVSLSLGYPLATLPPGARMLALHSPASLYPHYNLIWLAADGRLMVWPDGRSPAASTSGPGEVARWSESAMGALECARCHGEVVTLLGRERIAWLVRDAVTGAYSFRTVLPGKPVCTFGVEAVKLAPYVRAVGDMAEIEVEVGLSASYGLTADGWYDWIDRGVTSGVDTRLIAAVVEGIGEAVGRYLRAVADARLTVGPLRGFASHSGRLAGDIQEIGDYAAPKLWISSTRIESGRIVLKLLLDAVPRRVYARLSVGADDRLWSDLFPEVHMSLSGSVGWWNTKGDDMDFDHVQVSGPVWVSHTDGSGEVRSRGFAISSLSSADCASRLRLKDDFRVCLKVSASQEMQGISEVPLYRVGAIRLPDFSGHTRLKADGLAAHEDGFALWHGNRLLLSDPQCPVVYPYELEVGDTPIAAAFSSLSRRSLAGRGRSPLYIFSADGVREVEARDAGAGEVRYMVGKLIGRDVVDSSGRVASTSDGVVFASVRGLMSLSSGGRIKRLSALPVTADTVVEISEHYAGGIVAVSDGNRLYVYDMIEDGWIGCEVMLRDFISHGGRLYGMESRGNICELQVNVRKSRMRVGASTEGWRYQTEPLMLGAAGGVSAVAALDFGGGRAVWQLEGGESGEEWERMASGEGYVSGLLLMPRRRFWRVSARGTGAAPESLYIRLR